MSSLISRLLVSIFVVALASCSSTDTFYVNAGVDQTVQIGSAVTLVGTADSPDGSITNYEWIQTSGETIVLTGSNTSSARFTAPTVTADIVLTFQLIVHDSRGGRVTDDVNVFVTVLPPVDPENPVDPTPPPPDQATSLEIEPNNILSEADVLSLGDTVSGQVANDTDQDWFEVNLVAGTNYRVQFAGSEGSEGFWNVLVYDSSTNLIGARLSLSDTFDAISFVDLDIGIGATGKYYVVVEAGDAIAGFPLAARQPYAVTVIESPISNVEIESNNSLSTADALTIGDAITGQLAGHTDQDWFSFTATAGSNIEVQFTGSASTFDFFGTWNVKVSDSSNNILYERIVDAETGVTSSIILNPSISVSGTYYVIVEGNFNALSQPYTITVNVL